MAVVPLAKLSPPANDKPIPLLGLGTAAYPFNGNQIKDAVIQAIELGYRHFDSAALYGSEVSLGAAIAEALRLGLVKSRDEFFITTKLWCTDAHRDCVLPALLNSLKNLGLEYVDLYLVHWPVSIKPGPMKFPDLNKEDLVPMDFKAVWEAMEECQQLGFTKSIGVSNFSSKKLELLLSTSRIPPAVNQLEINHMCQQKKLREFCEKNGVHVTGYSPLGASGTPWGSNVVVESKVLQEIAHNKGESLAQICLRWAYEQGVSVIVKSFNKGRMVQNLDIFDWKLSSEESEKISELPQRRGCDGDPFIFPGRGPYKSLDDLWDEEV